MAEAEINGFAMHYEDVGTGDVLAFIHGNFPCLGYALNPADSPSRWPWASFADDLRFITYDRRGCYGSACPPTGYALTNQADDLAGLLDHVGIDQAHLMGSSAGGPIALAFSARYPARVSSLVLVGTAVDMWRPLEGDEVEPLLRYLIDLLDGEGPQASLDARPPETEASIEALYSLQEWIERGQVDEQRARREAWRSAAASTPREMKLAYHLAELESYRAYFADDARQHARSVRCPTLVLHGENDRMVPLAWGKETATLIEGAELVVVPERSHGLLVYSPEARSTALEFVRSHKTGGRDQ
jgi:pimeloyl-ACP methyl ester carboxylesterase